jgi:hypothetical protein
MKGLAAQSREENNEVSAPNGVSGNGPPADSEAAAVAIPVIGLSLGGCGAKQVEHSLLSLPGVLHVYVNPATEIAYIRYDPDRIGHRGLRRRIEALDLRTAAPRTWR